MNNFPTFKQMQYLMALAQAKNFRKASEACHISQPTLSAAIKEMENLLGADVLDRSQHKKVIFTSFGKNVLETTKRIAPLMEDLKEKAKNLSAPFSGPIRIGLIPTITPYLLPTILPELQKKYPKIEWQIVEGMSANLIQKMKDGALDLAIIAFPYEIENFAHEVFFEEEFYCAAPKNFFGQKKTITYDDLEDKTLLLLEDGHCLRDHALSACKLQGKREEQALSATSLQTLIQMVEHGYGITLLPRMVIESSVVPQNVDIYRFKNPKPTRKIGVVWRKNAPNLLELKNISKTLKTTLNA